MRRWILLSLSLGLGFLSSCTSGKKSLREQKVSYLESVKLNFDAGEEALKDGEYDKAITYFQFVRSKYPFSMYASLSDLRIADVRYAQQKWFEAASAYEVFIRLHPRHERVPYASYRVGVSYYNAIPSDFFLLPKAASRDQTYTKEALSALERFILEFPQSEFVPDAQAKRSLLFSRLAQHNQFVAAYYHRRGRDLAAIHRYLRVQELYPETSEAAESLFLAAELYLYDIKDVDRAKELYRMIIDKHGEGPYLDKAKARLSELENGKNH